MIEIIELINFNCYFFTKTWEQHKLGEFYNFKNGLNKEKAFFGSGVPIVNFVDVFHNRFLMPDMLMGRVTLTEKEIKSHEVKQGDIFFTRTSETINEIGYPSVMLGIPDCTVFSGFVLRGRAIGNDPLNNLFKSYIFFTEHFRKEMIKKSSMTTRALTSGTALKEMIIKFPVSENEQTNIGTLFKHLDVGITLQQRQLDLYIKLKKGLLQKLFPKNEEKVPEVRFADFTGNWELRKLSTLFNRVNERNNGQFNNTKWISVSQMYFQSSEKVQSNNIDTRTYVMRKGDIAFEGHPNKEYKFGRFVANDIGDGVVSELFPVYRPIENLDLNYLKFFIHQERIMEPIFAKSITSSGNSSNKLNTKHFLKQSVRLATLDEQHKIGSILKIIENAENLQQEKVKELKLLKEYLLQKLFI